MDGHALNKVADDISIGIRACGLPAVLHSASSASCGALVCLTSEANSIGRDGTEACAEADRDLTILALQPGLAEKRYELVPLGRNGAPQEIANAVLVLAGARSTFFTSGGVRVDGATAWYPI